MTTAELKLNIFRKIDALESNRLKELYGLISNFTASENDVDEWTLLSEEEQTGIINALEEADSGKLVSHKNVMNKAYKKISNAIHS